MHFEFCLREGRTPIKTSTGKLDGYSTKWRAPGGVLVLEVFLRCMAENTYRVTSLCMREEVPLGTPEEETDRLLQVMKDMVATRFDCDFEDTT